MENTFEITSELKEKIIGVLEQKLADGKRRAIPMPDIFAALEPEAKKIDPNIDRYRFQKALSALVKTGQMPNIEVKIGKGGGLGWVGSKSITSTAVQTSTVEAPAPVSEMELNGKTYQLALSKEQLNKLLTKVFSLPENLDGNITFDDRKFLVENSETKEILDNLVFHFQLESQVTESLV